MAENGFKRRFIGETLVSKGLITEEQLHSALEEQKKTGRKLAAILIRLGFVKEEDVINVLAEELGFPFIDLDTYQIDEKVSRILPVELIKRYQVFPLFKIGEALTVAMSNPLDIEAIDELVKSTGMTVKPVFATASGIKRCAEQYYGEKISLKEELVDIESLEKRRSGAELSDSDPFEMKASLYVKPKTLGESKTEVSEAIKAASLAPVVKLVDLLISDAIESKASDIHLEPDEDKFFVRFRVDGVLYDVPPLPKRLQSAIISKIKIMANMDIAEKRLAQDGRIKTKLGDRDVDLRVSTFPTLYGENISIRILDKTAELFKLQDLGFSDVVLKEFKEIIHKPYGMILVTGPTGSGKTTTLYAVLNEINNVKKNIMTLEDPVEYIIPRIRQSQVNVKAGLTFANGLRSILRQDPDIIMIGEIRDAETAEIVIQSALTGHLVFSTLHTNDASSTANRLVDMQIESFLVASSLAGILAQRLVRRLCPDCRKAYAPTKEELNLFPEKHEKIKNTHFYREVGCASCRNTGYKGRIGIYELLILDDNMKELIVAKAPAHHIQEAAGKKGMRTLKEDGLGKVLEGLTSLSEVLRVTETT